MHSALAAVGDEANSERINALVCAEVEKEKRFLHEAFEKKVRVIYIN